MKESELTIKKVGIKHEPVELYRILKFEGLANSGAEAKQLIDAELVTVNGAVETRRRKKIVSGDQIVYGDWLLQIELISKDG